MEVQDTILDGGQAGQVLRASIRTGEQRDEGPVIGLAAAMRSLSRACGVVSGRTALDCVALPGMLEYAPSLRALRLIRQSRISAW